MLSTAFAKMFASIKKCKQFWDNILAIRYGAWCNKQPGANYSQKEIALSERLED